MRWLVALVLAAAVSAHADEVPAWFQESFLDMREELADATKDDRRVMLYFWQNGCKYCRELVSLTLNDPKIAQQVRRGFLPVPVNILGAREVTLADGRTLPEKDFAAYHKVRFTPTIVFLDENGAAVHRIHGFQPPEAFSRSLDAARLARLN